MKVDSNEQKVDPYKNRDKYLKWKENNNPLILSISKENSKIAFQYLEDMEKGIKELDSLL